MVMLTLIDGLGQLSCRERYNSGQDYMQWERGSGGDAHYSPDTSQHRNHPQQHVSQSAPVAARGEYGQLHAPRAHTQTDPVASHRWANACDPSVWETRRRPASIAASPLAGPVLLDTRSTIANVGLGHRTSPPYSSSDNTPDEPYPGFAPRLSRDSQHPSGHLPTTQPFGHNLERCLRTVTQKPPVSYPPHAHDPRILYPGYNFLAQPNMQYPSGGLPCFYPQSGYQSYPPMGPCLSTFPQPPNAQHPGPGIATPVHSFYPDPLQTMQLSAFAKVPAPMPNAMRPFFEPRQPIEPQPSSCPAAQSRSGSVSPD